jgi:hypothetical protein
MESNLRAEADQAKLQLLENQAISLTAQRVASNSPKTRSLSLRANQIKRERLDDPLTIFLLKQLFI